MSQDHVVIVTIAWVYPVFAIRQDDSFIVFNLLAWFCRQRLYWSQSGWWNKDYSNDDDNREETVKVKKKEEVIASTGNSLNAFPHDFLCFVSLEVGDMKENQENFGGRCHRSVH